MDKNELLTENISITDFLYGFLLSGIGNLTEVCISCIGEGNNSLILILIYKIVALNVKIFALFVPYTKESVPQFLSTLTVGFVCLFSKNMSEACM